MDAARWCRHLVPDGSVYAFLADHRHELFLPALFADLARQGGGHASVPVEVVVTVMVLQALEGLSDREAISALRRDIVWKVACGLRLDDEGFHPTMLVYWRNRLRASARPRRVFEVVSQMAGLPSGTVHPILARLETVGWLTSRWEQIDPRVEGRPTRRYYRLTPDGLELARAALARAYSATARPAWLRPLGEQS